MDGILKLVAEGTVTPEEAERLLDASAPRPRGDASASASARGSGGSAGRSGSAPDYPGSPSRAQRNLRIEVTEHGRRVVNLRLPLGIAGVAASLVPGLSEDHIAGIRRAVEEGMTGTILDLETDDGDRVVIATD